MLKGCPWLQSSLAWNYFSSWTSLYPDSVADNFEVSVPQSCPLSLSSYIALRMVWLGSWEQSGLYKNSPSLPHGGRRRGKISSSQNWISIQTVWCLLKMRSWCCWSWSTVTAARMSLASSHRPLAILKWAIWVSQGFFKTKAEIPVSSPGLG